MPSLPIAPPPKAAPPPGTALKSASPPTSSARGDFAALLDQTSARTAPAEGPDTRPAAGEPARRRDRDDDRRAGAQADPQSADAPATGPDAAGTAGASPTPAAAASDQSPAQGAGPQADGPAVTAPVDGSAQAAAAALAVQTVPAAAVSAQPAPAAPAGDPATPAQAQAPVQIAQGAASPAGAATIAPGPSAGAAQVQPGPAPVRPDAATAPDGDPAPGKLQIPAELLAAKGEPRPARGKDIKNAGAQGDLPPLPTLPPSANAAATAPATAGGATGDPGANANHNGAQPQPAAPGPPAAAQPAATPQAAAPGTGAPVFTGGALLTRASVLQTAERVQELVRIATTRAGNARATLQLRPEALGQVDVQLRTTRAGLVATIAAHDQAGLDALQQASGELRRTLADRGVELHSLDLQLGAGDNGFTNQGDARQANSGRSGAASRGYDLDEDDDVVAEDELTIATAPSTAAGALVDVTA